jgi:two-component system response regulator YesN
MKVLIIDDEARHRRGMTSLLNSIRPHYEVLTANNGAEALGIAQATRLDIVITDIRMPNMDGIAFMDHLRLTPYQPKVIVLSAYNLFEYAQSAIQLGAYDYLLKPVDSDKVEDILQRIEEQNLMELRELHETDELKRRFGVAVKSHHNRLLHAWLSNRLTQEDSQEIKTLDSVQGPGMIVFSSYQLPSRMNNEKDVHLQVNGIIDDLVGALSRIGRTYSFALESSQDKTIQVVSIIQTTLSTASKPTNVRQVLVDGLGKRVYEQGKLSHGVGLPCIQLLEEGAESYRTARACQVYTFYDKWLGIVCPEDLTELRQDSLALDHESLFEAIHQGNSEGAIRMIRIAFDMLTMDGHTPPSLIKEYASLSIMKLKSRSHGLIEREVANRLTHTAIEAIPYVDNYKDVLYMLEQRVCELSLALQNMKRGRSDFIVDDCIRLVKENYMEDLKLETLAELFHFNTSYFSTLFKNQTGRTFSEYLTDIRMSKAKQLLSTSSLRIYEIAELCGHRDPKYFCRLFKKHMGVTPEAYRYIYLPHVDRGEYLT